ncbi:MAG: hypothetical protein HOP14_13350 [Acidobacteria bacterium]|nr:hypothetical protein [Acidobacteriota bacterium]
MKSLVTNWGGTARLSGALLWLVVALLGSPVQAFAQADGEVLTNQGVLDMVSSKLNRDIVVAKVTSTSNAFDVTVNGVVNLTESKLHQEIIRAMIVSAGDEKRAVQAKRQEAMTNQAVIYLVVSKVARPVILSMIQNNEPLFDVSANGLVQLSQAKVHSEIIRAMVARAGLAAQ